MRLVGDYVASHADHPGAWALWVLRTERKKKRNRKRKASKALSNIKPLFPRKTLGRQMRTCLRVAASSTVVPVASEQVGRNYLEQSLVAPGDSTPHEDGETGSDWTIWERTIDSGGSANRPAIGPGGSSLAATLSWHVAPRD